MRYFGIWLGLLGALFGGVAALRHGNYEAAEWAFMSFCWCGLYGWNLLRYWEARRA